MYTRSLKNVMINFKEVFGKKKIDVIEQLITLDREFLIGEYVLKLKESHVIDKFYNKYPLYDRFLPVLCSEFYGLVIDIGANIGDTAIAIFSQNKNLFIVGVEPDPIFFEECQININANNLQNNFLEINKFVSSKKGFFKIEKNDTESTGHVVSVQAEESSISTISFSELMNLIPEFRKTNFDILKIDTDGFDWDVLKSFLEYSNLNKNIPRFIFFEMQTFLNNEELLNNNRDNLIKSYKESLKKIKESGYTHFCLFDNFGTHIKVTNSLNEIYDLMDYINRSQIINKFATIYYFDVLAFSENELIYVNDSLNKFYKNAHNTRPSDI